VHRRGCARIATARRRGADRPDEAAGHFGETTTVCGVVASTRYADIPEYR